MFGCILLQFKEQKLILMCGMIPGSHDLPTLIAAYSIFPVIYGLKDTIAVL